MSAEDTREAERKKLEAALNLWSEQWDLDKEASHPALAHPLTGQYAAKNFSLQSLNYHDRYSVSKLQEACKSTDFYVCLASMTRWASGESDGPFDIDYTADLEGFVDCDGSKLFDDFAFHGCLEYNMLDRDVWDHEDPDTEEWGDPHDMENDDFVSRKWKRNASHTLSPREYVLTLASGSTLHASRSTHIFLPR